MVASVYSVPSLPLLFFTEELLPCTYKFNNCLWQSCSSRFFPSWLFACALQTERWRCSEFLRSVCVTGGEAWGRAQPKPDLPAGSALEGVQKGVGGTKEQTGVRLRGETERSRKIHCCSWWPQSTSLRGRFIFPVLQSKAEKREHSVQQNPVLPALETIPFNGINSKYKSLLRCTLNDLPSREPFHTSW